MSAKTLFVLMAGALGMVFAATAADEAKHGLELGKQEYMAKCASCHGATGKGNGDFTRLITTSPPDLTTYAQRNGGYFPKDQAWMTIDGRTLDDHVQRYRGMPVWGQNFRDEALTTPAYHAPESYAAERIGALVDYLATIQVE